MNSNDILHSLEFYPIKSYLYRISPFRSRLSQKLDLKFHSIEKMIDRYKDQNSMAGKCIGLYLQSDRWKFAKLLSNYLTNYSIAKYLRGVFSNFNSVKDRVKSIRILIETIFTYKILISLLGIDLECLKALLSKRDNELIKIRETFIDYLSTCEDERAKHFASKIFRQIF